MVVDVVIAVLCLGIVIVHLLLYAGVVMARLSARLPPTSLGGASPSISVVVACRNEEKYLPLLLESLRRQSLTDFEVVLVDDRSTDGTPSLMAAFASHHPGRVRIVRVAPNPRIANPKQNALARGTREADSDVLLFTDGDCTVPERWVEETARLYGDPSVGLTIGAIVTRKDLGFVSRFHAFEHLFKYGYTAGSAGIGAASGGFGNNLSVRRRALEEVGGFESLSDSTTEDAALVQAVRATSRWKVRARLDQPTLVTTEPLGSLAAIAAQEVRWHVGGLFSADVVARFGYGYLMLFLSASVFAIPFIPFHPFLGVMTATSFVTMGVMALIAGLCTGQPRRLFWLPFVPNLLLTMGLNSYLTVRALVRRRVTWKGTRI